MIQKHPSIFRKHWRLKAERSKLRKWNETKEGQRESLRVCLPWWFLNSRCQIWRCSLSGWSPGWSSPAAGQKGHMTSGTTYTLPRHVRLLVHKQSAVFPVSVWWPGSQIHAANQQLSTRLKSNRAAQWKCFFFSGDCLLKLDSEIPAHRHVRFAAGVHGFSHGVDQVSADAEVAHLHLTLSVDQHVGGFHVCKRRNRTNRKTNRQQL